MRQDRTRTRRTLTATAVAALATLSLQAATAQAAPKTKPKPTGNIAFSRFSSCDAFLKYVRPIALEQVGPYGFDQYAYIQGGQPRVVNPAPGAPQTTPAAAPVAPSDSPVASEEAKQADGTSTTNTQEAGVDEGDIVETDGTYVYASIGRKVYITNVIEGKTVSEIDLPANTQGSELILDGKRLAIINTAYSNVGPESVVTVVDVSNPAAPVKLSVTHLEGLATAVRSVDHRARLILTTSFGQRVAQKFPQPGPINTDADRKRAIEANKKVIRSAPASDWLPRAYQELANGSTGPVTQALSCGEVGRPRDSSGLGLTWIATIDLDTPNARGGARGSAGVVAAGGITYASSDTIYVATQKWFRPTQRPSQSALSTEVHAFDMRPADGAAWLASGSFIGVPLNQYSMSEHNGALRIASTRFDAGFGGTSVSGVQVMMLDSNNRRRLVTVGELWGLGTNERIYSVRFVGDQGYVVTFRQTDPLYVLDLTDRRAPKKVGELKIPGYSSYLHSIGDGWLIGIGQNATEQGQVTGSQASLFDVSNPANPTRLATLDLGTTSGAEYDPKAFLWWPESRDLVLPTYTNPYTRDGKQQKQSSGAVVARVGTKGSAAAALLTRRGVVSHDAKLPGAKPAPTPGAVPTTTPGSPPPTTPFVFTPVDPIVRSLIVSGRLVTVSGQGIMTSDLTTLAESRWVRFEDQGPNT